MIRDFHRSEQPYWALQVNIHTLVSVFKYSSLVSQPRIPQYGTHITMHHPGWKLMVAQRTFPAEMTDLNQGTSLLPTANSYSFSWPSTSWFYVSYGFTHKNPSLHLLLITISHPHNLFSWTEFNIILQCLLDLLSVLFTWGSATKILDFFVFIQQHYSTSDYTMSTHSAILPTHSLHHICIITTISSACCSQTHFAYIIFIHIQVCILFMFIIQAYQVSRHKNYIKILWFIPHWNKPLYNR